MNVILVDTSVWIDHLHRRETALLDLLHNAAVVRHPMVVGELAVGNLKNRPAVLGAMSGLPLMKLVTHDEVLNLIEARELQGSGLSLVDVHLLGAVLLSPGTLLWTRDKRLYSVADGFGINYSTESTS